MKIILLILFCCSLVHEIKSADIFSIDGSNYYSSYPEQVNWYQALRFCAYNGMYLIDIRTYFENTRVLSVINKVYSKYNETMLNIWTSGTDLGSEGQFYWATTGHQMLYANWGGGEPSNSSDVENCVHFWGLRNLLWNDVNCLYKYYFICRDTFDIPVYKSTGCDIRARESF